ncbi:hypothetical protein L6164_001101 [Bauhinia variegata]|uniref:Uncharacterized protein n=1 Tax=Bauhinia variegata TaxID=167791 RepID=A0ACB9Q7V2_BAUVA|nr:hypothetical protein L6164_001101 [Bauhinia variegata]
MELDWLPVSAAFLLGSYAFVFKFLRKANGWYYEFKLGQKENPLPPGDMGWPLVGNLFAFTKAFKFGDPDSFINNLMSRYGKTGIYKTHLFGNPTIIVCTPEMCRRVLTDDQHFRLGYPKASMTLAGTLLRTDSPEEHKRLRRLTTAPIVGHNALAVYVDFVEDIIVNSLEEWASMNHPIDLLKEMKEITFKVIVGIFSGSDTNSVIAKIGYLFTILVNAIMSLPINIPGFTFHKALQARKKLATTVKSFVGERKKDAQRDGKKDLVDILLEIKDENGQKLKENDIVDLLIMFLLAGYESTSVAMMWSTIYLTEHPQITKKAKEEQEEIIKTRPSSQKRLNIREIKQMTYLAKVIDEMLRKTSLVFATFREAQVDVNINGYTIPKGWRVLNWARAIHMNPEYHPNPQQFNPSRWDEYAKVGSFLPFGIGSRQCPGMDLAKLQISIFLHYFLLNYKLERVNPECRITYLPVTRPVDNCLAKVVKVA